MYRRSMDESEISRHATAKGCKAQMGTAMHLGRRFLLTPEGGGPSAVVLVEEKLPGEVADDK
jgi:hypothetical protein